MNDALNLVWMLTVVALLAWMLANATVMACIPLLNRSNLTRERYQLWSLAAAPWMLPLASVATLAVIALLKAIGWIDDHCTVHAKHHPHFCLEHLPDILLSFSQSMIAIIGTGMLSGALVWQVGRQVRQHSKTRLLQRLASNKRLLKSLSDHRSLAFTVGVRTPVMFLSSGLKNKLTKRQQRIVAAHEATHIRHQDVLKNTLFEILLSLHVYRAHLRQRWHLNTEARADSCVAQRFDRLEIAEVLLTLEREAVAKLHPVSIAGASSQARIRRLLQPSIEKPPSTNVDIFFFSLFAALPVFLAFNHHAIETLLGWWLNL